VRPIEQLESRQLLTVIPSMPSELTPTLSSEIWDAAQSARLKLKHPLFTSNLARLNAGGEMGLYVHASGNPKSVAKGLKKLGASVTAILEDSGVIDITIAPAQIGRVARLGGVKAISLPDYVVTNVTSEGDAALNADDVRSQFVSAGLNSTAINGTGIKVGVISDGADHRANVGGELPAVTVDPDRPGDGDEGTAMLEIVHDLAPGAQLYFSGPLDSAEMVQSINYLVTQGCNVIVDDLSFFGESYFSDSSVAQAAASAVAQGVVYVTSSGNYSNQRHYQAQFTPGDAFQGGVMHRFAGTDDANDITVPSFTQVIVFFQWSDAWGSTPAASDYRIYLTDTTGKVITNATTGFVNGTPFRGVAYFNGTGASKAVQIRIVNMNNSPSRELEFFEITNTGANLPLQYSVAGDALIGHEAVDGVMAIAAANASSPTSVASYSSRGGSTIYTNFATQTKVIRQSLDGTGIDGVSNRVGQLGYFVSPFYGTSAAAPHVAAIAALVKQLNPSLTQPQVVQLLNDTATDISTPGYDINSGAGLYNALSAVYKAYTPSQVDLIAADDHGTFDDDNLTNLATPTFSGSVPSASFVRLFVDGNASSSVQLGAGVTSFSLAPGAPLSDGPHAISIRLSSSSNVALGNNSNSSQALNVSIDTIAPHLNSIDFNYDVSVQNITATFDTDVAAAVQNTDLNLTNESTGDTIPAAKIVSNPTNDVAFFSFTGLPYNALPDGYYSASIAAGDVTDAAGNGLPQDAELSFYFMAGDANHDAAVDSADLGILSVNWNQSPRTFSQGDFSYDGRVDVEDIKVLASHWQTTLTPSQQVFSAVAVSSDSSASSSRRRIATSVLT
jgi:hypothetical protein